MGSIFSYAMFSLTNVLQEFGKLSGDLYCTPPRCAAAMHMHIFVNFCAKSVIILRPQTIPSCTILYNDYLTPFYPFALGEESCASTIRHTHIAMETKARKCVQFGSKSVGVIAFMIRGDAWRDR